MKKLLTLAVALSLCAAMAQAETVTYGWEDGGTILGMFPADGVIVTNVGAPDPVHDGFYSLKVVDNAATGTPQAFVAFIWGLMDGDVVTAGFWRYDDTPDVSPSCRIWAHWNDELPGNPDGYTASASGNSDYGLGLGWDFTSWDYTVVDGHTGLVIECRTYSNPGDTVWIDDLQIIAPDHAFIQVPGSGPIANENQTWGQIKSLYSN